jgi:putative membrane protein
VSVDAEGWHSLDKRTLLTGPLKSLSGLAVPVLIAAVGAASSGSWVVLLVMAPLYLVLSFVFGALPWLTTHYRITPSHLEVKTGFLNVKTLSARLDRVRSVDLEASVLHRALGITRIRIGTGADDSQITLDALAEDTAEAVRRHLLHRDTQSATDTAIGPTPPGPPTATSYTSPAAAPLARLRWSWLRFAPLNLLNLAVVGSVVLAGASQVGDQWGSVLDFARSAEDSDLRLSLVIPVLVAGCLALWILGSCLGYAVRWFGLTLTRDQGKDGPVLHQSAGLLTTRSTTVEESKVRGARIRQQLLIAAVGGADLAALTLGRDDNTPALLPTAPLADVRRVAIDVLTDAAPVTGPLLDHGRRPLGRYLRRILFQLLPVAVATVTLVLVDAPRWAQIALPIVAVVSLTTLALVRWRNLGHALTGSHLVAQSGALVRDRTILEIDGIVGWSIRQTPFDRRLGLAQLTATTAAGDECVVIHDVPLAEAVRISAEATPALIRPFLAAEPGAELSSAR